MLELYHDLTTYVRLDEVDVGWIAGDDVVLVDEALRHVHMQAKRSTLVTSSCASPNQSLAAKSAAGYFIFELTATIVWKSASPKLRWRLSGCFNDR